MSEIRVQALGENRYGVELIEGEAVTGHTVLATPEILEGHGLAGVDAGRAVHEAMGYLLDRQPATAIRGDFSLEQLGDWHPDFWEEMAARLS